MKLLIVFCIVVLLVVFSAICSGLNVAIMALDPADLRRKAKLGNKQAIRILPLRRRPHLSLASILITNVAAVSATSLVLSVYFNGWLAGVIGTFLIVIFGEVLPQALFLNTPLLWSSRFAGFLKIIITVTFVMSRPLEWLLDRLFPLRGSKLQSRQELGLLITEHLRNNSSELDEDEIEIMRGALMLSEKRVRDILTSVVKTFWLTPETVLDDARIDEIKAHGYSRIPIFDKGLTKCYGVLLLKDLVDVDFDETSLSVADCTLHPTQIVGSMMALDTLFRVFIGSGSHLIPVERDDQIIGIVTIEDLIEEILGHEIEDETDRLSRESRKSSNFQT